MEQKREAGRTYLWVGAGLGLAAPLIFATRFGLLRHLETPWYFSGISALAVIAIGLALFQRRTWRRAILFLIVLIECLGSTAMLAASELEPYDGPAQVGAPLPASEAKLAASGEAFTEADLASGTQVLVFYRGHL